MFQDQIIIKRNTVSLLINCSSRNNVNPCAILCDHENKININEMLETTNAKIEMV